MHRSANCRVPLPPIKFIYNTALPLRFKKHQYKIVRAQGPRQILQSSLFLNFYMFLVKIELHHLTHSFYPSIPPQVFFLQIFHDLPRSTVSFFFIIVRCVCIWIMCVYAQICKYCLLSACCCLPIYCFRAGHFVLDNQLVFSSLGEANYSSLSSY